VTIQQILDTYGPQINAAAAKYGVPASLIASTIQAESSGNPGAVSSEGAIGLMQLMPSTAVDLGVDPTDPGQNIDGGTRYLSQMFAQFGSWDAALAAYNAGPRNYLAGNIGAGTVAYVNKILGAIGLGPSPGFQWPTPRPPARRPLIPPGPVRK
jgi:soluble lytic murein transglycosylase-like protein